MGTQKEEKKQAKKVVMTKEVQQKKDDILSLEKELQKSGLAIIDEANKVTMGLERSLVKLADICANYRKQKAQHEALSLEVAPFEDAEEDGEVTEEDFA